MTNKNLSSQWTYIDDKGSLKLNRQSLYQYLKDNKILYVSDKHNLYKWKDGYYQKLDLKQIYSIIKSYIPVQIRIKRDWVEIGDHFLTDEPDFYESQFNQDEDIIVFNNGVVHLSSLKMTEHNPKHLVNRKLDCNYLLDADIDDAPVFADFIFGLSSHDGDEHFPSVELILEFIGAVISNVKGWRFKKMLLLVGPGNTGKSKLREFIMYLVGSKYYASIDLKRINERFGTGALFGKRLAGSGDMSYMAIQEMDKVKELTGGDTLMAEYKGKDMFSYVYDGFLLCNANRLPYFRGDRGQHVYDRMIIAECLNVIPKDMQDPMLLDKLKEEKDVIASISILRLCRAIDRGYRFTESTTMEEAKKAYRIENNSLYSFMNECCNLGEGYTKRTIFKKYYKIWCMVNNVQPERDREIDKLLFEFYGIRPRKTLGYYQYDLCIDMDKLSELDELAQGYINKTKSK